jgi:hypothetical protein
VRRWSIRKGGPKINGKSGRRYSATGMNRRRKINIQGKGEQVTATCELEGHVFIYNNNIETFLTKVIHRRKASEYIYKTYTMRSVILKFS